MRSLLTPIYACQTPSCERGGFLRPLTTLFNFGQKSYRIIAIDGGKGLYLERIKNKPSWVGVALGVIFVMSVIVPILSMIAIAIYRSLNSFASLKEYAIRDFAGALETAKSYKIAVIMEKMLIRVVHPKSAEAFLERAEAIAKSAQEVMNAEAFFGEGSMTYIRNARFRLCDDVANAAETGIRLNEVCLDNAIAIADTLEDVHRRRVYRDIIKILQPEDKEKAEEISKKLLI